MALNIKINSAFIYFIQIQLVICLFEQCNHKIDLKSGQKIYINSPYYPADYPIGTSCRYTVNAPLDHELSFKCSVDLNVQPTTPRCQNEVFYFNREGSEVLTSSDYFCGNTKFERTSFLNRAVISYISQPFFKRTLIENFDLKKIKDDKYENETKVTMASPIISTTTTSTTTEAPAIDIRENDEIANAFAYLTELLIKNATLYLEEIEENDETTNNTEVNDKLPQSVWRKKTRTPRIVVNNGNIDGDTSYYGYLNNRGGGRFSCLVEVIKPSCDCGWSTTLKIAGATGVAGINEFPSMAGVKTRLLNQIFCGAAIIHHRYLLSAAHCFMSAETNRSELINVVVGENDLTTVLESFYTRTYEIQHIILHENYYPTAKNLRNDIALLRTRLPIEWNRSVGPACLPLTAFNVPGSDFPRKPPLPGQKLDTAGWGTTSFGGMQSTRLLKTTLDIFPTDQCRRALRSVPPGVFCTYTPGRDTCQYDSGGALYVRSERLFAVGIISYGFACAAQQPAVNTRIASFLNWIKEKTPEVSYCVK